MQTENSPWPRRVAFATAALFFVSLIFPIAAGLSHNTASFPKWWGPVDVILAFVLGAFVLAVFALVKGRVSPQGERVTYRAYRVLIHGILALLVVFFLFRDRIVWIYCLTGLAWRTWLLLYSLPAWLTAIMTTGDQ